MSAYRWASLIAAVGVVLAVAGSAVAAPAGWSGPTKMSGSGPATAVSCPSATFCAAVGTGGFVETFNGSAWSSPVDPDPNGNSLTAVSCPSAAFCAAVDNNGNAITYNGSAWSSPVPVDTTRNSLSTVACVSSSLCVAGDVGGNAFVFNGSGWSGPFTVNHVSNSEGIGGISCPSASFCVAAGQAGSIETSTNGGSAWSTPINLGANRLTAVSCPSSSFCVAVDTAGNAYTYNGSSWSGAAPIDTVNGAIGGGSLDSVSCPSASFCAAIDGREGVVMFNGSSWTAPASLVAAASRPGVSCPSSSFCMAVDGTGNAFAYGAASATPPPPVLGKSVNAAPVAGVVLVRVPGSQFVPLTAARQIPVGSEVDALKGSLKLVTAGARQHTTQTGTFGGGIFKVAQARTGPSKGLATLSLMEGAFKGAPTFATCKTHKAGDASAAALSSKTLQLLHANAKGKFRTTGRYSAATVRGTVWSVADRCDGTLTHVVTDTVAVVDFVRHKTIILHAGQSYLARAPAAGH